MKRWLRVLFTPSCWLQNNTYNAAFDKWLRARLADSNFENIGIYHATIGGVRLWVANHPYASFNLEEGVCGGYRPSRATVLEAMDALMIQRLEESMVRSELMTRYVIDKAKVVR